MDLKFLLYSFLRFPGMVHDVVTLPLNHIAIVTKLLYIIKSIEGFELT